MSKIRFTGESTSYIFEGAGGMRDQLEQLILSKLEETQYPVKAEISVLKSSAKGLLGALTATKEQCVVISIDKESKIAISNTTVGTYLYVEVYMVIQERFALLELISQMTDNVFKRQKRRALYRAAVEATEKAFTELNLRQCNSGYKRHEQSVNGED